MGDRQIIIEKNNRLGRMVLNRPEALNALSYEMLEQMSEVLERWQNDPQIYGVILESADDSVFCAGGDVREVRERGRRDPAQACQYLKREYRYNWQLENFTKPHISLINGPVFGGGVGISVYGTHRVAGEGFALAMPETAIGFVPDVGASRFLGHLPYSTGLFLALTGRTIGRADALSLGLVTHTINSEHFPAIREAISAGEPVDSLLDGLQTDPGREELKSLSGWIEAVFSASTLEEIFERAQNLGEKTGGWSLDVLSELRRKSPTSLRLAHEMWKKGRFLSLRRALELEYCVVCNLMEGKDFYEGVRAKLIDKDNKPSWQPDEIKDFSGDEARKMMRNQNASLDLESHDLVPVKA